MYTEKHMQLRNRIVATAQIALLGGIVILLSVAVVVLGGNDRLEAANGDGLVGSFSDSKVPRSIVKQLTVASSDANSGKTSPNKNQLLLQNKVKGGINKDPQGHNVQYWHVLRIDSDNGSVIKDTIDAYHSSGAASAKYTITASSMVCDLSSSSVKNAYLRITINGHQVYKKAAKKVCASLKDGKTFTTVGTPTYDPLLGASSNRIVIAFTNNNGTTKADQKISGTFKMRFLLKSDRKVWFSYKANAPSTEFGVVGQLHTSGAVGKDAYNIAVGMPFGLPCTMPNNQPNPQVKVYDPDPSFGDSYVFILYRKPNGSGGFIKWTKLPKSEYRWGSTYYNHITPDKTHNHWVIHGGQKQTASFTMVKMQPKYQYMLVMYQPFKGGGVNGSTNPANNLLSFSLPGASINGQIACRPAAGSFEFKPTTTAKVVGSTGDKQATSGTITASAGDTITFSHKVVNKGGSAHKVDAKGGTSPDGNIPKANWQGIWDTWWKIDGGVDTTHEATFHKGGTNISGNYGSASWTSDLNGGSSGDTYTIKATDLGKKICSQVTLTPHKTGDTGRVSSTTVCVKVVPPPVVPTVQFWGYDARIDGDATTDVMRKISGASTNLYGSWSEYGAQINGTNSNDLFASGAAYHASPPLKTLPSVSNRSLLTFANNNDPTLGDVTGQWGGDIDTYDDSDPLVTRLVSMCDTTNTTLLGSSGPEKVNGTKIFCNMGGTIEIKNNIEQTGSTTIDGNTPQIIVLAKNIIVDPKATDINAWLVAVPREPTDPDAEADVEGGLINTCYEKNVTGTNGGVNDSDFLTFATIAAKTDADAVKWQKGDDDCNDSLTVTGPVMSRGVYLNRTTDPSGGDAAGETFNLRADAFVWAFNGGAGGSSKSVAQTVSIKELPPRF